ncbi:MAG: hypothetical protein K6G43_10170 [Lachnospiraceae bacterium]|nr:hypothetical protein [Lachnospiraceae bacterium]
MMYCPKCREAVGEDIRICPFCRHKITDYERELIEKARLKEEEDARAEEDYKAETVGRVRVICFVVMIALGLIVFVIFCILMYQGNIDRAIGVLIGGYVFLGLMDLYLILGKRINDCPHCGKYLHLNYGTQCQWCGKRIR